MRFALLFFLTISTSFAWVSASAAAEQIRWNIILRSSQVNMLKIAIEEMEKAGGDLSNYDVLLDELYDEYVVFFVGKDDKDEGGVIGHNSKFPTFEVGFNKEFELVGANYSR